MNETVISFSNISKVYRKRYSALKNINLELQKGEFLFLVGPSGSGKTTLLKHIYMEEKPDEGDVFVLNTWASKATSQDITLLRRKIGVVFQDFKLLADRKALQNVSFVLEVIGYPIREAQDRALKTMTDIGMATKADSSIFDLSGGEQQKVAIARALVREPVILIADEPTGNIDPAAQDEILELLVKVHSRGTTVIMATHNYALMDKIPIKRIVQLERGEIKSVSET